MILKYILLILFILSILLMTEFVIDLVICYRKVEKVEMTDKKKYILYTALAYFITFLIVGV